MGFTDLNPRPTLRPPGPDAGPPPRLGWPARVRRRLFRSPVRWTHLGMHASIGAGRPGEFGRGTPAVQHSTTRAETTPGPRWRGSSFLPVRRMRDNTRRRCVPPSGGLLAGSGGFGSARCGSRRHRTPPTAPAPPHPDAPPGSGAATTPPPTATPRAATPHASVCLSRHGPPPDNAHHSALAPEPVAPQAGLPAPAPSPVARVCQDADWQGRVPPEWARREVRAPSVRRPHRSAPMR